MKHLFFVILGVIFFTSNLLAQEWKEVSKIVASDRAIGNNFGNAVAISGNYAVVGAQYASKDGIFSVGAAYIYYNNAGNWQELQKLTPADGTLQQRFGISVAISGNYLMVGSTTFVYIFHNNNGIWNQVQKIEHSGFSMSMSGNYALLSGSGCAFMYYNNNGIWELRQEIIASDNSGDFGKAVSISGDYAIIGAPQQHNYAVADYYEAGAAYIFYNNNGTWQEMQKITASNACSYGNFGYSLAITEEHAIVGANYMFGNPAGDIVNNTILNEHYIYFFPYYNGIWSEGGYIAGGKDLIYYCDPNANEIGQSISISDDYVMIGVPGYWKIGGDGVEIIKTGAVYIFGFPSKIVTASDAMNGDSFGKVVALSEGYAIVGVPDEDEDAEGINPLDQAGAVYILKAPVVVTHPGSIPNRCVNSPVHFLVVGYNITGAQWQVSTDGGNSFTDLENNRLFSGTQTATLNVIPKAYMNNYQFRCIVYSYDETVITNAATLTIEKEKPVILSSPDDQLIFGDQFCKTLLPDYTVDVVATDNCDNDLEIIQTPAPGTLISGVFNTITIKVADDAGNSESVSFNVAVENHWSIVLDCVENPSVVISARDSYYTVSRDEFDPVLSYDYCGGVIIKNDFNNQASLAGAQLPVGYTWIQWVAIDVEGNHYFCGSVINVSQQSEVTLSESGISICPNPTKGMLHIEIGNNMVQNMVISDLNGNVIIKKSDINQVTELDLTWLNRGIYIITLQTGKETVSARFVKE